MRMNFSTFFNSDLQKEHEKQKKYLSGAVFAVLPAVIFYLMEAYEHNPFAEVRQEAQLFNILLMELLAWGFFFLLGSGKWAVRLLAFFAMVFGLVNHYVTEFRSTPFVPWDLFSVKTAASVAGNYDFTPEMRVVIVTAVFCALLGAVHFLQFDWKQKWYVRLAPAACAAVALALFGKLLQDEGFQNRHYLYPFLFTPAYMTKVNGMAVTFTMNLAYVVVEKPKGYDREECRSLLAEYEKAQQEEAPLQEELPNIIVIMDEAFSDLSVLGEVPASEDYMPYLHRLQQGQSNTITGFLNVSVCGGDTANTEFEFLTGNTMAFLPSGSIPYQQYLKEEIPSLASHLAGLGYETCAMHPYPADGWNRKEIYPLMGFERMEFLPDYRGTFGFSYVRNYVSDRTDFQKIIETYEQKEAGTPLFVFNVTMQNHGSYTKEYDNFTADIMVKGADNPALDRYLSLLRLSDQALEELISYFDRQEEKTVIVFFGDHQPNNAVAHSVFDGNDETLRYQVPYLIWANYEIGEQTQADTSANYLAAHVLEAAGVPTSPYQDFLLELETHYPVLSAVRREQTGGDGDEDALLNYQKLQYYLMFDRKGETE